MRIGLLFLILVYSVHVRSQIQGRILDANTKDPMAYVKITCGANKVYSNVNGIFELPSGACDSITAEYVGYSTTSFGLKSGFQEYFLQLKDENFETLIIKASENPAYRVMREVVKHKKENNPLRRSFQYHAYNKFFMTLAMDSAFLKANDDTTTAKIHSMLQSQYLFFTESVINRQRENARNDIQFILYERTAGFKNHALAIAASELQSFSMYNPHIQIGGIEFLNPISRAGLSSYEFVQEGYELVEGDTVFTILFEPKNNSFKGLKGHFKINSFGYAVQYADVEPLSKIVTMDIKIKQIYERHDSLWFPSELNTRISVEMEGAPPVIGSGRTLIKDLEFDPDLSKTKFSHLKSVKAIQEDIDLSHYRDSLSVKEQTTYEKIDSVGQANKFDLKLSLFESLVQGRVPMGKLDLDLSHLLTTNEVEGFRAGLGLVTSPKFSKHFELSGYGAYGFRDKRAKYGAGGKVFFHKDYQTNLLLSWQHDLWFWGNNTYALSSDLNQYSQFQEFFLNRADMTDRYSVGVESRLARHFKIRINAEHRQHSPGDSLYSYRESLSESVSRLHESYQIAELSGELRFVFNEKFSRFFGVLLSNGSKSPQIHLKYRMGLKNSLGDFKYHAVDLLAFYNFKLPFSGRSTLYIKAAWQDRSLPIQLSNSLDASFKNLTLAVPLSFETMRINEFFADDYISGGILYNALRLYKHENSAPELILVGRAAIGDMKERDSHLGFDFSVPRNIYAESGFYLNNLYVQDFIGFGLGALYRIGNYALERPLDNLAIKFTLNISI